MENVEITVWRKINCNFYNKAYGEGENDAKSGNI